MNYYTIQVKTRTEKKFIKRFTAVNKNSGIKLYFPEKEVFIRKEGLTKKQIAAILPCYIFIEVDSDDSIQNYYWLLRKTEGFVRFLRSNHDISPISGSDLEMILYFIKKIGPIAVQSKVIFDENSRIVVLEGPLKGFEGKIIRVDKRKGRARIKLDLYEESHWVDLSFEVMASA